MRKRKAKNDPFAIARKAVSREIRLTILFVEVHGQAVPTMAKADGTLREGSLTMSQAIERFGLPKSKLRNMWYRAFETFVGYKDYESLCQRYPSGPAEPSSVDPYARCGFHPELMTWLPPNFYKAPVGTPPGYAIFEDWLASQEWLFTVVVNPRFSPAIAEKIALLVSCAPKLWRHLRKCILHDLNNGEWWPEKSKAIEELQYAAERWPFEYLHPNAAEEKLITDGMAKGREGVDDATAK